MPTPPGGAVISQLLRAHSSTSPRSRLARLLGRSPLSDESRPRYLGALGEREVGNELANLGSEWTIVHAVPIGTRGSDIDHIVVGPPGVFTINTKFHEDARVWVGSRRLLVNGQKKDHLRSARFEASRVAKILSDVVHTPVVPLVAIAGAREIIVKEKSDVVVLKASRLTRWLCKRPAALSPEVLEAVASAIADPTRWGTPVELAGDEEERFTTLQREVRGAKRTKMMWGLGILCGVLAAVVPTGLPPLLRLFGY